MVLSELHEQGELYDQMRNPSNEQRMLGNQRLPYLSSKVRVYAHRSCRGHPTSNDDRSVIEKRGLGALGTIGIKGNSATLPIKGTSVDRLIREYGAFTVKNNIYCLCHTPNSRGGHRQWLDPSPLLGPR